MQAIASVASGLIAVGSSNHLATSPIINALINMDSKQLKDPHARLIPLALGLCQLGKRQDCETIIAALEVCCLFSSKYSHVYIFLIVKQ